MSHVVQTRGLFFNLAVVLIGLVLFAVTFSAVYAQDPLAETDGPDFFHQDALALALSDGDNSAGQSPATVLNKSAGRFDGTVIDWTGTLVDGAEVDINGLTANTDSTGYFALEVEESEGQPIYVVNVRKPGHGLYSRIYDRPADNVVWQLPPATTLVVDPTQPIVAQAPFASGACQGALSSQVDWSAYPDEHAPVSVSGNGIVNPVTLPPELETALQAIEAGTDCSAGFTVRIPANALVDASGNPPSGQVEITIATIDLFAPNGMPGDLTVETEEETGVMESFGAGSIEIRAGGKPYNLRPGMQAELTIPIDPLQLAFASAPPDPTIPLIVYDEPRGVWTVEGEMKLNAAGDAYVVEVGHFTVFNADLVKSNQSCVRVNSPNVPGDYSLEVTIPIPNRAPVVLTRAIDNTPETLHAIVNLPSFTDIVLRPFRNGPGGAIPLGTFLVNTGPPQNPTNPNRPPYPYAACQKEIFIDPASYVSIDIFNNERYTLVFADLSVNGQSPRNIIPRIVPSLSPAVGVLLPEGLFNIFPGDQVDYYFEFAPLGITRPYYTDSGSITIRTGRNEIQTPDLRIGQVLTLFHPSGSREWLAEYDDHSGNIHSSRFIFSSNDQWALYYDNETQPRTSGTVQVVIWDDNSSSITINLSPACNLQNITLNDPFDPMGAKLVCQIPQPDGPPVTAEYIRQ